MTTSQRLSEAELDRAIRDTQECRQPTEAELRNGWSECLDPCDWRCAQGREHDCPAQASEWPDMANPWTLIAAVVIVCVCVFASSVWPNGFTQ